MTVKELKNKLEEYPEDAIVTVPFTTNKRAAIELCDLEMDDVQNPETEESHKSVHLFTNLNE